MSKAHEVLGVAVGATEAEIRAAYLQLVKRYHPDKHQDNDLRDLAEARFKEIQAAYEELCGNPSSGSQTSDEGPNSPSWTAELLRAQSLIEREQYLAALVIVDQLLEAIGSDARLHDARGWALLGLDREGEAKVAFGAASALAPGAVSPLLGLATASINDSDLDTAHRWVTKAVGIAVDPEDIAEAQEMLAGIEQLREGAKAEDDETVKIGCGTGIGCLVLILAFGGAAIAKFRGPSGPLLVIVLLFAFGPIVKAFVNAFKQAMRE